MRRALLAVVLASVAVLVVAGLRAERSDRFSLGVPAAGPVATLDPGREVCQSPIGLPEAVDAVSFTPAPGGAVAGPLKVSVRAERPGGGELAAGVMPRRRLSGAPVRVAFARVGGGRRVALCVRNDAPTGSVHLYGEVPEPRIKGTLIVDPGVSTSAAIMDGRALPRDLSMTFPAAQPRSVMSLLPSMFERAGRWRAPVFGAWTLWLMLAGALILAPLLLARSLLRAVAEDESVGRRA